MSTDHAEAPRGHDDSLPTVTVVVATFPTSRQARIAELVIGRLAAEGAIDVFDGEVHEWSAEAPTERRRTLENLPRLAALPPSVWASGAGLPQVGCTAGSSAIVLFGSTENADHVQIELVRVGGATTITLMTAAQYAQLRRAA